MLPVAVNLFTAPLKSSALSPPPPATITLPLGNNVALGSSRAVAIAAVVPKSPCAGSKISHDANIDGIAGPGNTISGTNTVSTPPTISTRPSRISTASWRSRCAVIGAVAVNCPLTVSYNSVESSTAGLSPVGTLMVPIPPVTSTIGRITIAGVGRGVGWRVGFA